MIVTGALQDDGVFETVQPSRVEVARSYSFQPECIGDISRSGQMLIDAVPLTQTVPSVSYAYESSVQASPAVQNRLPMASPEVVFRSVAAPVGRPQAASLAVTPGAPLSPMIEGSRSILAPAASVSVTPGVPLSPMAEASRSILAPAASISVLPGMPSSPMADTRATPVMVSREMPMLLTRDVPPRQEVITQAISQTPATAQLQLQIVQQQQQAQRQAALQQVDSQISASLSEERPRIYSAVQEMVDKSARSCSETLNSEMSKLLSTVQTMVNAVSTSCDERLVRLEVDRAARTTTMQAFKRDIDTLQEQFGSLSMSKSMSSDVLTKEREEMLRKVDASTKEVRNQYHSVIASLASQKEEQAKVDSAFVELRNDQRSLLYKLEQQSNDLQGLQSRAEKTMSDLQVKVNLRLQGFLTEMEAVRNSGNVPERVVRLEGKTEELYQAFLDHDIAEVRRVVNAGSQQTDQRMSELRTQLRAELDAMSEKSEKLSRSIGGGMSAEDRSKILTVERSVVELRNMVNAKNTSSRSTADALISKDIQDLHGRVSAESTARLDLSQSLDAYRNAYLQTTTELRQELDVALEKVTRLEASRRTYEGNDRISRRPSAYSMA